MLNNHPALKNFFAVVGMLFLFLLIVFVIVVGILFSKFKNISPNPTPNSITTGEYNPAIPIDELTEDQKKLLSTYGIDPSTISITDAQIQCATKVLGQKRIQEIKQGDTPTLSEMIKAKSCL